MKTQTHNAISATAILVMALILFFQHNFEINTAQVKPTPATQPTSNAPNVIPTMTAVGKQSKQTMAPSALTKQSAKITYMVPSGLESIQVLVYLEQDHISSITTTHSYGDRHSARYQAAFDSQIESLVVGKKISAVQLSRVAGASLTTEAFMRAIKSLT